MCVLGGAADDSQKDTYMDEHMRNRKVSVNFVIHPHDGNMPKQNDLLRKITEIVLDDPWLSNNVRISRWNQQESEDVMTKWKQKKAGLIIINRACHTAGMIDVYEGHKTVGDVLKWIEDNIRTDAQVIEIFDLGKEYLKITDAAGAKLTQDDKDKIAEIIEKGKKMLEALKHREESEEFEGVHINYEHLPIDGRFAEAFLKHMKKFARLVDEKKTPVRDQINKELERLEALSHETDNMKASKRSKVITRFWSLQWLSMGKGDYSKMQEEKKKFDAAQEEQDKARKEQEAAVKAEKEAEEKKDAEEKAAMQKAADDADDLDAEWEGNVIEDHPAVPQLDDEDDQSADLADNDAQEAEGAKEVREYANEPKTPKTGA